MGLHRNWALALAAFACLLFAQDANAQTNWSGLYIGGALGGRMTSADLNIKAIDEYFAGGVQHDLPFCQMETYPCATDMAFNSTAFRAASYVGLNWQLNARWIVGLEADWGWAGKTVTKGGFKFEQFPGPAGKPDSFYSIGADWDASARLRAGYLISPAFLVYATGGAAWLNTEITSSCGTDSCFPGAYAPTVVAQSRLWTGWTIGGGVEAKLGAGWFARAEYRYADYGSDSFNDIRPCVPSPSPACGIRTSLNVVYDVALTTQTVMFGLAYNFSPGAR